MSESKASDRQTESSSSESTIENRYLLIDAGANLTNKKYNRDLDAVIERAQETGKSIVLTWTESNRLCNHPSFFFYFRDLRKGVRKIVVSGNSVQGSRDAIRLSCLYPNVLYASVGECGPVRGPPWLFSIQSLKSSRHDFSRCMYFDHFILWPRWAGLHPHAAKSWEADTLDQLRQLALESSECVAIGECGLDYKRNFSPPDEQLRVFEHQVQLAVEVRRPLLVHERDAHDACLEVLRKYRDRLSGIVIRCFTGNQAQLRNYLDLDCYIGVSGQCLSISFSDSFKPDVTFFFIFPKGFVWRDNSDDGLRQCLIDRALPINRLLLESDSPYMCPAVRGKRLPESIQLTNQSIAMIDRYCGYQRNEPCSLAATVELVAHLYQIDPEELSLKTTFNALKIFGLK